MRPTNARIRDFSGISPVGKLRSVLILGINQGLVITTRFDAHDLREAEYGRADLHRPGRCFSSNRMRPAYTRMLLFRAIDRSVNYVQYWF